MAGGKIVASTTTAGSAGIWRVDNVPQGSYAVVFGRARAGAILRTHSVTIVVNEENEAPNQSIQWLRTPQAQGVAPVEVKKTQRSRSH